MMNPFRRQPKTERTPRHSASTPHLRTYFRDPRMLGAPSSPSVYSTSSGYTGYTAPDNLIPAHFGINRDSQDVDALTVPSPHDTLMSPPPSGWAVRCAMQEAQEQATRIFGARHSPVDRNSFDFEGPHSPPPRPENPVCMNSDEEIGPDSIMLFRDIFEVDEEPKSAPGRSITPLPTAEYVENQRMETLRRLEGKGPNSPFDLSPGSSYVRGNPPKDAPSSPEAIGDFPLSRPESPSPITRAESPMIYRTQDMSSRVYLRRASRSTTHLPAYNDEIGLGRPTQYSTNNSSNRRSGFSMASTSTSSSYGTTLPVYKEDTIGPLGKPTTFYAQNAPKPEPSLASVALPEHPPPYTAEDYIGSVPHQWDVFHAYWDKQFLTHDGKLRSYKKFGFDYVSEDKSEAEVIYWTYYWSENWNEAKFRTQLGVDGNLQWVVRAGLQPQREENRPRNNVRKVT